MTFPLAVRFGAIALGCLLCAPSASSSDAKDAPADRTGPNSAATPESWEPYPADSRERLPALDVHPMLVAVFKDSHPEATGILLAWSKFAFDDHDFETCLVEARYRRGDSLRWALVNFIREGEGATWERDRCYDCRRQPSEFYDQRPTLEQATEILFRRAYYAGPVRTLHFRRIESVVPRETWIELFGGAPKTRLAR